MQESRRNERRVGTAILDIGGLVAIGSVRELEFLSRIDRLEDVDFLSCWLKKVFSCVE